MRDYLEALFPPNFRFGTGAVIDSSGARSGQLDVVIEQPLEPSFPLPGTQERLYFAESVAAVIEIKSDMANQWAEVERTARSLAPLTRNYGHWMTARGRPPPYQIPVALVGYEGPVQAETLARKLSDLNYPSDVCAFVIRNGAFAMIGSTRGASSGVNGFLDFAGWIMDHLDAGLSFNSPRHLYRAGPQPTAGDFF